jgi:hypothetical protein
MLDPSGRPQPGEPLTEPRLEVLYEDGSPSAAAAYPLAVAVRTEEPQRAVRGHRDASGAPRWIAVDVRPLSAPGGGAMYGVLGILSDVSAEQDWRLPATGR